MKIEQLFIYPIKSCQGIPLNTMKLDARGPLFDREWMLIDEKDQFLTQRQVSVLAQVRVSLDQAATDPFVRLDAPNKETIFFSAVRKKQNEKTFATKIWKSHVEVVEWDVSISQWFSEFLQISCSFVGFVKNFRRAVSIDYNLFQSNHVGFADAFPLLLTNLGSLADLNQKLPHPVNSGRFRPNIVVSGLEPFAEENLYKFHSEKIEFANAKPCIRCPVINIDQDSGVKDKPKDSPLYALGKYRMKEKGITFGINLIHRGEGSLTVGDELFESN